MFDLPIQNEIIDTLSNIFSMALIRKMDSNTLASVISHSKVFIDLENGDDNIFYCEESSRIAEIVLNIKMDERDTYYSDVCRWMAEGYFNIFLKYAKSFEYIFIYLPIDKMVDMFNVYHEMDWSHLFNYFEERIKGRRLLTALIKKNELSLNKLAVLSGVSYNTIEKYSKNDEYLYNASFINIMAINKVLNSNINTYLKELPIEKDFVKHPDNSNMLSALDLMMASYVDRDLSKMDFQYDEKNDMYHYQDLDLIVIHPLSKHKLDSIKKKDKTILILHQDICDDGDYLDNYYAVYFINNNDVKKRHSSKSSELSSKTKQLMEMKVGKIS